MKKLLAFLLALCISLSLCACGAAPASAPAQEETVEAAPVEEPVAEVAEPEAPSSDEPHTFVDDCGRELTLPAQITKVAVSGPLAQMYVLPMCPDLMVGFASQFSENIERFVKEEYRSLPLLGQLYGGKGTMDLEALLAADPDVVIDVGEAKGSIVEDLDGLTEQTGIPFVHIDATLTTSAQSFRRLGELLGRPEKAEEIAAYLEATLADINAIMEKVDAEGARKTVVYCLGDKGLNVLAQKSFHAEAINMTADNIALIEEASSSGMGNEVDMEQLMLWNPEYIIFAPDSCYEQAVADPMWQQLDAVKSGKVYKIPGEPYNWVTSPPSVQRYLGILWLTDLFYPDYVDYNLKEEVTEYYKLFYDYELSAEEFAQLTANSREA